MPTVIYVDGSVAVGPDFKHALGFACVSGIVEYSGCRLGGDANVAELAAVVLALCYFAGDVEGHCRVSALHSVTTFPETILKT